MNQPEIILHRDREYQTIKEFIQE